MNEDRTDVLGRRIGAALLDLVLMVVLFVIVGVLFGESETGGDGASINLEGAAALLFFALVLLYYGGTEAATGQTVGKRVLGIRVVTTDGAPASTGKIAARTVLRIVDALPAAYLLGFVVVLATGRRRQRIGDLAAGTTVVSAR